MKKCVQKLVPVLMEMSILILNEIKLRVRYRNKD